MAQNEMLFRDINEQIKATADGFSDPAPYHYTFLCECSNSDCALPLSLTLAEYENVRAQGHRFVVAPGHDLPEIEDVIERHDGYEIVAKRGEAAAHVAAASPGPGR